LLHHFDICVPYVPLIFFFTIQSLFFSFIVYHWSFNKNKKTVPLSAARITYPSDSFGSFTIFSWVVVAGFCFLLIIVCLVVHFLRPLYCMFFGHYIVCSSAIVLYVLLCLLINPFVFSEFFLPKMYIFSQKSLLNLTYFINIYFSNGLTLWNTSIHTTSKYDIGRFYRVCLK
jgi:hypothetical protein